MIVKIADNIISPLGFTTEENYVAIKAGRSALCRYEGLWNLPEPFVASLFDRDQLRELWQTFDCSGDRFTLFEQLLIMSVARALQQCSVDATSKRVVFILSTTKGNVHLMRECLHGNASEQVFLGVTARSVSQYFGNPNMPIVVSNACISGVCAQIEALRTLEADDYDYAIVMGAEVQSPFIVSGFQSFKALSPERCKPFDAHRQGLNLGEAAATIIYAKSSNSPCWAALNGVIRNDANHISGPSRTGEGSYRALIDTLGDYDRTRLALLNVHGTATLYNDEMESIAINRAQLSDVPVNALKGYYGHTMGAAGVMESILSMRALDDHTIIGTQGYEEHGVSQTLSISAVNRTTNKQAFVKLLSGFGGCNAALLFEKQQSVANQECPIKISTTHVLHHVTITPKGAQLDGVPIQCEHQERELLAELYRKEINDYPKFFKMDALCKLGFVATELLLKCERKNSTLQDHSHDRTVLFFNRTSSYSADFDYQKTIQEETDFFPSPSVFVYTLPNIVTGEVAIRNKYYGETNFFVLPSQNEEEMNRCLRHVFQDSSCHSVITGWIDCKSLDDYYANIVLISDN